MVNVFCTAAFLLFIIVNEQLQWKLLGMRETKSPKLLEGNLISSWVSETALNVGGPSSVP